MIKGKKTYTGKDLAFIIPTKDRPEKVRNLLQSIAKQGIPCCRIILVDSGSSIKNIVDAFSERLPVEYYRCDPPGQIRQRNMGIALLDGSTRSGCLCLHGLPFVARYGADQAYA